MKIYKKLFALAICAAMLTTTLCACVYDKPAEQTPENTNTEPESDTANTEETFSPSTGIDDNGKWEDINVADYVTLPEIKGVQIPAESHAVAEEDVQSQIESICANLTTTNKITDRAVIDGDTVNIDFVGRVDGVEFEGGNTNGAGQSVTIGVTNYIDDFLEQLIGHMPGETIDINVTFPDPYENNPDLAGKPAVFTTTINNIEEQVTPELTDALVNENFSSQYGWTTIADMDKAIRDNILTSAIMQFVQEYLVSNSQFSDALPQSVMDYQKASLINSYKSQATSYGMDYTEMLTQMGFASEEDLIAKNESNIEKNVKLSLALQSAAEQNGFEATEDNIKAYFLEATGSEDYSQYTSTYGEQFIKMIVLQNLAMTYIKDNAVLL